MRRACLRLSASSCFAAQLTCLSNGCERHCSCTLAVCLLRTLRSTPTPHPPLHHKTRIVTNSAPLKNPRPDALSARRHYSYGPTSPTAPFPAERLGQPLHFTLPCVSKRLCVAYTLLYSCPRPGNDPPLRHLLRNSAPSSLCRVCLLRCAACTPTVCLARDAASPCPAPRNACSRLLRTETAFGRPPQHAATPSPSQPHDGPVSCSDGSNYASASPFPVFQNAYASRILRFSPRRVPLVVLPPASCGDIERTRSSDTTTVPLQNGPFASPRAPTLSSYAPRALHSRRCGLRLTFTALCAYKPRLAACSAQKTIPDGPHLRRPPRVCSNRGTASRTPRMASTTPPLHLSLCFKTPMRCVHTVAVKTACLPLSGARPALLRRLSTNHLPYVLAGRPTVPPTTACRTAYACACLAVCRLSCTTAALNRLPGTKTRLRMLVYAPPFGRPTTLPETHWTDIGTRPPAPPRASGPPLLLTGRSSPPMPIRR